MVAVNPLLPGGLYCGALAAAPGAVRGALEAGGADTDAVDAGVAEGNVGSGLTGAEADVEADSSSATLAARPVNQLFVAATACLTACLALITVGRRSPFWPERSLERPSFMLISSAGSGAATLPINEPNPFGAPLWRSSAA